ncbi:MAG: hypothetical protein IH899_14455 [Planctomycetes bacterium]|nr:hypothetical protein [Planctomycetota bacterium]
MAIEFQKPLIKVQQTPDEQAAILSSFKMVVQQHLYCIAIQEFIAEKEPEAIMANLRDALVDYLQLRQVLVNMAEFIATKAKQPDVRRATEALASRIRHQRLQ